MSRPIQYDEDELLQSLRATFLELGPGAPTGELARRAGVSEGTLFKRFGTKKLLFARAMRLPLPEEEPWFADLLNLAGQNTVGSNLEMLSRVFLHHMQDAVPVMQMVFAHCRLAPSDLRCVMGEEESMPLQVRGRIAAYFAAEMDLGRMRRVDPRMLANCFVGALMDRVLRGQHSELLLDASDDLEVFLPRLVDTLTRLTAPG